MASGRGKPRVAAAVAEADGEHGRDAAPAQILDRGGGVGLDAFRRRLLDVLRVLEVVAALAHSRGAAEVVDRNRRITTFREAQRELLVEAVEPADVRQDDDADRARLVRQRRERRELRAVGRPQRDVLVRERAARDDGNRRERVELEAHQATTL